ncbi:MAG: ceramidase [Candidatus Thiodiazotropha weberae]|nr:ceramidase [Candidatus Thiodiazotropha lotti]MCG8013015.1 ceramidase [Candidatus Thiodiazotropha lotti]MCG8021913.1 ceramidase [Candidatus Thiodiazotropha lotti]MCW4209085.1 ceramidase [Candidatus Thiodiazotropha lotti]MCW4212487.1 ceramidase [Candidatus Thiodiazotropha lotti]
MSTNQLQEFNWKHAVLMFLLLFPLVLLLLIEPIPQKEAYHRFTDIAPFLGIPNFFDVISNLAFLLVGTIGIAFCLKNHTGPGHSAWLVLFAGVSLVGLGSIYYHWSPSNQTLVWDRLPMSVGFMAFLTALLSEYVNRRFSRLLIPLIIVGISSVLYGYFFDDLRLYVWVQFIPLLTLPFFMVLYNSGFTHQGLLFVALVLYALAKGAEAYDTAVFQMTGEIVSGHTVKHLLAAAGCYSILIMLKRQKLIA